jgi:mono/diheme cytochrome c family protein
LFLALTTASAQTPPSEATLTANPVYEKNCAKCHGKTAEGRHFGGPSLVSDKTTAASTDDLRSVIADGKGHMPKFAGKLTSAEIDTLVRQLKAPKNKG